MIGALRVNVKNRIHRNYCLTFNLHGKTLFSVIRQTKLLQNAMAVISITFILPLEHCFSKHSFWQPEKFSEILMYIQLNVTCNQQLGLFQQHFTYYFFNSIIENIG